MKTHEYIIDEWGNDEVKCQSILVYQVHAGCPGDDMTPSDPPSVEVIDAIIRIDRERLPPLDIPMADSHFDFLDIKHLEDEIYNEIFPYS